MDALVECGSCTARRDCIRNLRGGGISKRCKRQVKIAFISAVIMEAVFRIRKDEMLP